MHKVKQKSRNYKKMAIIAVVALVVLASGGVLGKHLYDTHHTVALQPTASQSTKGEVVGNSPLQTQSSADSSAVVPSDDTSQPGDTKSNSTAPSEPLLDPSGNFVSAHHISLSTAITSVCNTTPGADCKITFISGSTTKTLQTETTDRGGSAYWNGWTPKSIGLSAGSWKITAIATLNGQDKSASDATNLEIAE